MAKIVTLGEIIYGIGTGYIATPQTEALREV